MAVSSIQLGQVWRSDADGQDYLVTKVYNEVFSQFAMLRPAGITAPDAPTVRMKVTKSPAGRDFARLRVYPGRLVLARSPQFPVLGKHRAGFAAAISDTLKTVSSHLLSSQCQRLCAEN